MIPYYVVDAFTDSLFHGNPAGVCVLDKAISAEKMQNIAYENNLSETAFLVKKDSGRYLLRWFTPESEIDLCGHATLSSAYVLSKIYGQTGLIEFETQSGLLTAQIENEIITLNFPSRPAQIFADFIPIAEALGEIPEELYLSRDLLAVFKNEEQIRKMKPDFAKLAAIEAGHGVIVTAPGSDADFVSRFFAIKFGVAEDPVTGSSHSTLIPFWANRLGKNELIAKQLSRRGGTLYCKNAGERVFISGKAVLYSKAEILLV
jgi:PhzF family phenazine biosynthesis protein